ARPLAYPRASPAPPLAICHAYCLYGRHIPAVCESPATSRTLSHAASPPHPTAEGSQIVSAPSITSEIETASAPRARSQARTPEEWVAEFAEGWGARRGPDAFVAHFRDLLADDV